MFTKDNLGEFCNNLAKKPSINKPVAQATSNPSDSHFKSVLKELEENVSSDENED